MEPRPGEWRESDDLPDEPTEAELPSVTYSPDLIAIYTAFRDRVYSPRHVLYPSSGFDGSPAKVFVDMENGNEGCVAALRAEGLKSIKTDIRQYTPEVQNDAVILLNPAFSSGLVTRFLERGGYVMSRTVGCENHAL